MFYKNENGVLATAKFIDGPGYSLSKTGRAEYTYPVAGWHWFDTDLEAINALKVTWPENPNSPIGILKEQKKQIEKQIAILEVVEAIAIVELGTI
jgi:hypothetical protein